MGEELRNTIKSSPLLDDGNLWKEQFHSVSAFFYLIFCADSVKPDHVVC